MTIVEQVDRSPAGIRTRPGVDDAALVVKQVGLFATWVNQVVTGQRARIMDQYANFAARGCRALLGGVSLRNRLLGNGFRGFGVTCIGENRRDRQGDAGDGQCSRSGADDCGPITPRPHVVDSSTDLVACCEPGDPSVVMVVSPDFPQRLFYAKHGSPV